MGLIYVNGWSYFTLKKKAKIVLWFGGVISWTLIIPYSESTGVDQSYLKLLEGTPRTVKKNPWLFRHMLLKQWEKKISERVWNTHTTKCMRLLPIPYGKRKMTLQWKLVLDLGIFRLNHHWWKSLLVKLDIKMTLTNKLGKKNHKISAIFLETKKTPTFRASITKVPENTQNRPLLPGRPHWDFAHML